MKDLVEVAYILGIRMYRDGSNRLIRLSQSTCSDKVLKRFNMQDSKKGYLPMQHGIRLSKDQLPRTEQETKRISRVPYTFAIGSIIYVMTSTRPKMAYAIIMVSRYQMHLGDSH